VTEIQTRNQNQIKKRKKKRRKEKEKKRKREEKKKRKREEEKKRNKQFPLPDDAAGGGTEGNRGTTPTSRGIDRDPPVLDNVVVVDVAVVVDEIEVLARDMAVGRAEE
jgi:outer membrane biosynthesis protein TonB